MAQAVPMTLRKGLGLMVRIAVASAFLSSWTNFNAVYGVLTNSPSEIGAVVMNAFGDGSGNLYEGLMRSISRLSMSVRRSARTAVTSQVPWHAC